MRVESCRGVDIQDVGLCSQCSPQPHWQAGSPGGAPTAYGGVIETA